MYISIYMYVCMYVCMCVYIYTYSVYIHVCTRTVHTVTADRTTIPVAANEFARSYSTSTRSCPSDSSRIMAASLSSTNLSPTMAPWCERYRPRYSLCISITKNRWVDMCVYTCVYITPLTSFAYTPPRTWDLQWCERYRPRPSLYISNTKNWWVDMCVYTFVYIPLLSTYAYISPRTWDLQGRRGERGISEIRPLYIHHQESMSWYVCIYICVYTSTNCICIHISTNLGPTMVRAASLRNSLCISITKNRWVDMCVYTYIYIILHKLHIPPRTIYA